MLLSYVNTWHKWLWSGIYHPSTALRIADIDHEKIKIKQQSTTHASFLYQCFSNNGYGVAYKKPLQHSGLLILMQEKIKYQPQSRIQLKELNPNIDQMKRTH